MQQIMTIKELLNYFQMPSNRKNTLRLLKVLKKLQSEENCEILKKTGKHYYIIVPNVKKAFPSLFENANMGLGGQEKTTDAIQEYANLLRQMQKRISRLEEKILKLENNLK